MGCGNSKAAVDAVAAEHALVVVLPAAAAPGDPGDPGDPGSPSAVYAAASKLRSEVAAAAAAETERLRQSSAQLSQEQEAKAEQRLRETEEKLSQLLSLIESKRPPGGSLDAAAFLVHVPSLGGDKPAAATAPTAANSAAMPVALSDDDAAALKAALAAGDNEQAADATDAAPTAATAGLARAVSLTDSVQSYESESEFGTLDPDVVTSSSLLRLDQILKRIGRYTSTPHHNSLSRDLMSCV